MIAASIDTHWEAMHPNCAPTRPRARRRCAGSTRSISSQSRTTGRWDLRKAVFFTPRGLAAITGRDLERGMLDARTVVGEAAQGLSESEKAALASAHEQLITRVRAGLAAAADQAAADLSALQAGVHAARAALTALETALNARMGGADVGLPSLSRFLERLAATLDRAVAGVAGPAVTGPSATVSGAGEKIVGRRRLRRFPGPIVVPVTTW